MRTFSLVNADGTSYDLTAVGTSFLHDVRGLGFNRKTDYQQIATRFSSVRDVLAQQDVVGTIRFFQPHAAQQYFNFIRFLSNTPLTLKYNPGIGEFIRRGSIVTVEKTDSAGGALRATVTFRCTTPWYKTVDRTSGGGVKGGKIYDYTYDYTYADFASNTVQIESDSFAECPVRLAIYGAATNPLWRHYVNGQLVATGQVMAEIEEGRILVVDNTRLPYRIEQLDLLGNFVSDLYQRSNFATQRFISLRHGMNTITVAQEGASDLRMFVEAQIEYASV